MSVGLVGRKYGMTRIFTPEGESVPVTVVLVEPNQVVQLKTKEKDDYTAVQVKVGTVKANKVSKPVKGHYAKAEVEPGRLLHEFRVDEEKLADYQLGSVIPLDIFEAGQKVKVTGISKGKGYAGVIKRHNFRTQDASHGNSLSHRAPGSIGQNQSPGKVFKGKKMAGRMGGVQTTVKNLEVVSINSDKNLVLIKGSVPGHPGSDVVIQACQ